LEAVIEAERACQRRQHCCHGSGRRSPGRGPRCRPVVDQPHLAAMSELARAHPAPRTQTASRRQKTS